MSDAIQTTEEQEPYFECLSCSGDSPESEAVHVQFSERLGNDVTVCEDCAATCEGCGNSALVAELEQDLCRRCIESDYRYSEMQEGYVHIDNLIGFADSDDVCSYEYAQRNCYYDSDSDEWYVDAENAPSSNGALDYSANVLSHCHYDRAAVQRGDLLFGVELEMEPNGRRFNLVDLLGGAIQERFILKEDGSLDEGGVELVTVPLTLKQHAADFDWNATLRRVRHAAHSGANTHNCGIHIHINRGALTPLVMGKMLVFLNDERMQRIVCEIAQRGNNGYCRRIDKKISDGRFCSDNRYEALNISERTAELRIFRGNLRPERVLKNIEFAHALVSYCRDASILDVAKEARFLDWLRPQRKQYPNLIAFLVERNTLGTSINPSQKEA